MVFLVLLYFHDKSHLFLKFNVLREGSSFIPSFVEHPVYSNFKMYSVLILFPLF